MMKPAVSFDVNETAKMSKIHTKNSGERVQHREIHNAYGALE